jgi:hypothetical protein
MLAFGDEVEEEEHTNGDEMIGGTYLSIKNDKEFEHLFDKIKGNKQTLSWYREQDDTTAPETKFIVGFSDDADHTKIDLPEAVDIESTELIEDLKQRSCIHTHAVLAMLCDPNASIELISYHSLKGFIFKVSFGEGNTTYFKNPLISDNNKNPINCFLLKVVLLSEKPEPFLIDGSEVRKETETYANFEEEARIQQKIYNKTFNNMKDPVCPSVISFFHMSNDASLDFMSILSTKDLNKQKKEDQEAKKKEEEEEATRKKKHDEEASREKEEKDKKEEEDRKKNIERLNFFKKQNEIESIKETALTNINLIIQDKKIRGGPTSQANKIFILLNQYIKDVSKIPINQLIITTNDYIKSTNDYNEINYNAGDIEGDINLLLNLINSIQSLEQFINIMETFKKNDSDKPIKLKIINMAKILLKKKEASIEPKTDSNSNPKPLLKPKTRGGSNKNYKIINELTEKIRSSNFRLGIIAMEYAKDYETYIDFTKKKDDNAHVNMTRNVIASILICALKTNIIHCDLHKSNIMCKLIKPTSYPKIYFIDFGRIYQVSDSNTLITECKTNIKKIAKNRNKEYIHEYETFIRRANNARQSDRFKNFKSKKKPNFYDDFFECHLLVKKLLLETICYEFAYNKRHFRKDTCQTRHLYSITNQQNWFNFIKNFIFSDKNSHLFNMILIDIISFFKEDFTDKKETNLDKVLKLDTFINNPYLFYVTTSTDNVTLNESTTHVIDKNDEEVEDTKEIFSMGGERNIPDDETTTIAIDYFGYPLDYVKHMVVLCEYEEDRVNATQQLPTEPTKKKYWQVHIVCESYQGGHPEIKLYTLGDSIVDLLNNERGSLLNTHELPIISVPLRKKDYGFQIDIDGQKKHMIRVVNILPLAILSVCQISFPMLFFFRGGPRTPNSFTFRKNICHVNMSDNFDHKYFKTLVSDNLLNNNETENDEKFNPSENKSPDAIGVLKSIINNGIEKPNVFGLTCPNQSIKYSFIKFENEKNIYNESNITEISLKNIKTINALFKKFENYLSESAPRETKNLIFDNEEIRKKYQNFLDQMNAEFFKEQPTADNNNKIQKMIETMENSKVPAEITRLPFLQIPTN